MKMQLRLSTLSASLLAASLLVSSSSFAAMSYKGENYKGEAAAPCPQVLMLRDGFYVGGELGYDSYRVNVSSSGTEPAALTGATGLATFNTSNNLAATGWVGGLFLGYGQYFNNFYLAGEIFGNDSGATGRRNSAISYPNLGSTSSQSKFTANGSYGIAILPGVKVNDGSLLYARLGYTRANLKGTQTFSVQPAATGVITTTSSSNSAWQGGWAYGLGMEQAFYDNWSVRGEYTHTSYSSFSTNVTTWKPADNQYMLGVIYHFA